LLGTSLAHYVAVEPAMLEEELDVYTRKIREGKKVYGMDSKGNPVPTSNSRAMQE